MKAIRCRKCGSKKWIVLSPYADEYDSETGDYHSVSGKGDVSVECASCSAKPTSSIHAEVVARYMEVAQ